LGLTDAANWIANLCPPVTNYQIPTKNKILQRFDFDYATSFDEYFGF
jgi:hypothetical protein